MSWLNAVDKEAEKHKAALDEAHAARMKEAEEYIKKQHDDLSIILKSNLDAFPYVAGLAADYLTWDYYFVEELLGRGYKPERVRALKIREMHESTKNLLSEYKIASYQLAYLLQLFPELEIYIENDHKESSARAQLPSDDSHDSVLDYLSESEYNSLSENERNQRALDNYIRSHSKSKWQIGRDYELYVGYRLSEKGFAVRQVGIEDRLEDLGRDIIAVKNSLHYIVQCKFWSEQKTIHEKHIAQLYGTAVCYAIENNLPLERVVPVFYTNIDFSPVARRFAEALHIKLFDHFDIGEYPRIKCKVNYDEFGIKTYIYHLPMDQQYDSAKINRSKGDMYAFTVQEAVDHGFRRAYKWHGN